MAGPDETLASVVVELDRRVFGATTMPTAATASSARTLVDRAEGVVGTRERNLFGVAIDTLAVLACLRSTNGKAQLKNWCPDRWYTQ